MVPWPPTGICRVVRTVPMYDQLTWSGERHSVIWNLFSFGTMCSYAPTIIRHSPDGSCSVTIPSPAGHGGVLGASGGSVPPLVSRTPGSLTQVRSSVDTAENTCQP